MIRISEAEIGGGTVQRVALKSGWLVLSAAFLLGMAYLRLYTQVMEVSRVVSSSEGRIGYLSDRQAVLLSRIETLSSPEAIGRMLQEREIVLADPIPEQVVRVRLEDSAGVGGAVPAGVSGEVLLLSIAH